MTPKTPERRKAAARARSRRVCAAQTPMRRRRNAWRDLRRYARDRAPAPPIPGRGPELLRAYLRLARGEPEPLTVGRDYRVTRAVDSDGKVVFESQVDPPPGSMVDRPKSAERATPDHNSTFAR